MICAGRLSRAPGGSPNEQAGAPSVTTLGINARRTASQTSTLRGKVGLLVDCGRAIIGDDQPLAHLPGPCSFNTGPARSSTTIGISRKNSSGASCTVNSTFQRKVLSILP